MADATPGYHHPHPSPELARRFPFVPLDFERIPLDEQRRRGAALLESMRRRRSVRTIAATPVPLDLIETAIRVAGTAPSGANRQPWTFVVVGDPALKRLIREAAEAEEKVNYLDHRMNDEWQEALAPLGTDWHKEFLEIAPWLIVLFEQRHQVGDDGVRRHNYYVKESVGIAAGLFVTALHTMGLVTLPHTPSPMAFLTRLLDRPDWERPFALFPVGHPEPGTRVPDLERKALDEIRVMADPGLAERSDAVRER